MADPVRVHVRAVEVFGPAISYYGDSGNKFDEANQKAIDEINWENVLDAVNAELPEGYHAELRD